MNYTFALTVQLQADSLEEAETDAWRVTHEVFASPLVYAVERRQAVEGELDE